MQIAVRRLSPREAEVLDLICKGSSNREIAHHLGISEQSAKNHVTHIMVKLGARNRTEAVTMVYKAAEVRAAEGLCEFMAIPCQFAHCGFWSDKFHVCLLREWFEGITEHVAAHSKH